MAYFSGLTAKVSPTIRCLLDELVKFGAMSGELTSRRGDGLAAFPLPCAALFSEPPGDPVLMLKLEFLRYQHNLSDRQVIERAETDLGFRNFLRNPLRGWLPDPSSLCVFRGRLGVESFRQVFTQVIHLAREQGVVTCPAGQTSKSHFRGEAKAMTKYRFDAATCFACPLLNRCVKQPPQRDGRTVCKSDYQVEHQRARAKAATPQYAAIRREHPRVERKLGEVMNRHNGRRAHYRGRWKVLVQEIMACLATNVRRLVTLNCAPAAAPEA